MGIFSVNTDIIERGAIDVALKPESPLMQEWFLPRLSGDYKRESVSFHLIKSTLSCKIPPMSYRGGFKFDTNTSFKKYIPQACGIDIYEANIEYKCLSGHLTDAEIDYMRGFNITIDANSIRRVTLINSSAGNPDSIGVIRLNGIQNLEDTVLESRRVVFVSSSIPDLKNVDFPRSQLDIHIPSIESVKDSHPELYKILKKAAEAKEKSFTDLPHRICSVGMQRIQTMCNITKLLGRGYEKLTKISIYVEDSFNLCRYGSSLSFDPIISIQSSGEKIQIDTPVYVIDLTKIAKIKNTKQWIAPSYPALDYTELYEHIYK